MRILLTAFEPYDQWSSNSSWETIVELLRVRGTIPNVITRRYPVSLTRFQERLEVDLARGFDSIIHLGQAPGISQIHLEAIAVNVAGVTEAEGADFGDLVVGGPVGYRSKFPLGVWASYLRQSGIPARVSYHAGTYLCNAALYLSHHWLETHGKAGRVAFIHLPLSDQQVRESGRSLASMPLDTMVKAVGLLLDRMRGVQAELPWA
ncbi:MAG: pyroglutamyl-peptidase I [Pirellulaceae bacterium]